AGGRQAGYARRAGWRVRAYTGAWDPEAVAARHFATSGAVCSGRLSSAFGRSATSRVIYARLEQWQQKPTKQAEVPCVRLQPKNRDGASVAVQKSASFLQRVRKCGLLNQSHTRSISC